MQSSQIKKELSLRIKSYRKNKNLTQDELGSAIGIEQKNFSRLENGKTLPNTLTLCKLIEYGIEPNYLFGFLFSQKAKEHTPVDFELLDTIISLSNESKQLLRDFLKSLK